MIFSIRLTRYRSDTLHHVTRSHEQLVKCKWALTLTGLNVTTQSSNTTWWVSLKHAPRLLSDVSSNVQDSYSTHAWAAYLVAWESNQHVDREPKAERTTAASMFHCPRHPTHNPEDRVFRWVNRGHQRALAVITKRVPGDMHSVAKSICAAADQRAVIGFHVQPSIAS